MYRYIKQILLLIPYIPTAIKAIVKLYYIIKDLINGRADPGSVRDNKQDNGVDR